MDIRILLLFALLGLFILPAKAQNVSTTTEPDPSAVRLINDDRVTILRDDVSGQEIVLSNASKMRKRHFGCPDVIPNLCCPPEQAPTIEVSRSPVLSPEVKPIEQPKGEPFFLPDPVFFRINQSVIDASEWAKIEIAVNYLNENPNATCVVTGYADKMTGSAAINLRLSELRSNEVARVMETKYGIAKSRLSVNWKGDGLQPFKLENDKNRAVLFLINP
jgi:outer membrane protein OmpA-like peptidoglycan-associated protein